MSDIVIQSFQRNLIFEHQMYIPKILVKSKLVIKNHFGITNLNHFISNNNSPLNVILVFKIFLWKSFTKNINTQKILVTYQKVDSQLNPIEKNQIQENNTHGHHRKSSLICSLKRQQNLTSINQFRTSPQITALKNHYFPSNDYIKFSPFYDWNKIIKLLIDHENVLKWENHFYTPYWQVK